MKTKEELFQKINNYISSISNKEYSFKLHKLIEFEEGILASYQSKAFVENKSYKDLIIGLSPFIIDKKDGLIFHNENSYLDTQELIDLFRRKKGYKP